MSYCVECGVKLAPSEPECPLCGTRVCHPDRSWEKPEHMPWPDRMETVMRRIDRAYATRLSIYLMLIPAVTAIALDLVDGGGLAWSLYVIGALALLWCWILAPVFLRFKKPYTAIGLDTISTGAYLLLIALLTGGMRWYLGLSLPVILLLGCSILLSLLAVRRLKLSVLCRVALVIALIAAFLVGLEIILDLYVLGRIAFSWSPYAAIPLLALSGICAALQRNVSLREEIRKRLFL